MLLITYINRYVYDKRYIVDLYDENDRDLYDYYEGHHFGLITQGVSCDLWLYLDEFPDCDWISYILGDTILTAEYDYDMCQFILGKFRDGKHATIKELETNYRPYLRKIEDFEKNEWYEYPAV